MRRRGSATFVSIEAGRTPDAEPAVRGLSRKVKSHIALSQHRAGMRRVLWAEVQEALGRDELPKFGAHIVGVMPNATARDKLIEALNGSDAFGKNVLAEPVNDWDKLPGYLAKEATPQAAYRKGIHRVGGSIPLGELGGDRVRVSRDLRDALIRIGRVTPWRRTYARRVPPPIAASAVAYTVDAEGQGALFDQLPAMAAPQRERPPVPRPKVEPAPMLRLFALIPNVDVIAAMKTFGATHQEIADRLGLSRPQVTNILSGQFGASREIVRRVVELARAA